MEQPRNPLQDAFIAFSEDRLDDAQDLYTACVEQFGKGTPEHFNSEFGLAFVKAQKGDYLASRQLYKRLLKEASINSEWEKVCALLHQLAMVEREVLLG